jgi:hypothetical protein
MLAAESSECYFRRYWSWIWFRNFKFRHLFRRSKFGFQDRPIRFPSFLMLYSENYVRIQDGRVSIEGSGFSQIILRIAFEISNVEASRGNPEALTDIFCAHFIPRWRINSQTSIWIDRCLSMISVAKHCFLFFPEVALDKDGLVTTKRIAISTDVMTLAALRSSISSAFRLPLELPLVIHIADGEDSGLSPLPTSLTKYLIPHHFRPPTVLYLIWLARAIWHLIAREHAIENMFFFMIGSDRFPGC